MKPILVLGMHRSGTSATTRALGLLGASLGPPENLGKFWENQVMRRPNEELMEAFGGGWECPPALPEGWLDSAAARALVPHARAALAEYGSAPVIVWKDPRTCTTLPFWLRLLDVPPVVVFIHRHPVEVAASLRTRNQLSPAHSFAVWERFNGDALRNSIGLRTVVIQYSRLIEEPRATMRALVDSLARWGIELPNDPESTDLELTPKRRHHEAETDDRFDDPLATEPQRDLFALLRQLDGVSDAFELPRPLPTPDPISTELLELAARARASRREARSTRNELDRLTGSRRRLLRHLVESSLPGGEGRRHASSE